MNGLNLDGFAQQDIKTEPITADQLESMKHLAGSYEALFSRRARKYKAMGLGEKDLQEADYRRLILDEYTFLKRPVFVVDDAIFTGSAKKSIDALKQRIG